MNVAESQVAGQRWSPVDYALNGRFVAELGASLLDWLAPRAGERVLDLGCGDGVLSKALRDAGCTVVGLDASPELVAAARAAGLDARLGDGQALGFEAEFDAVFSNAALHWMKRDPDAVLTGVWRSLKPGGRFVAEMGGAGNVASIRNAICEALTRRGIDATAADPWYFPSLEEYRRRLLGAGFQVERIESYPRPTALPGDVKAWLRTFGQAFLQRVPSDAVDGVLEEVQEALRPLAASDGLWQADYVRLKFFVIK